MQPIERSPDLPEYQRLLRRAYEDLIQAKSWFAAENHWSRLCESARTARYHGVRWHDIERWLGSAIATELQRNLAEPKHQPGEPAREPKIVAPKEPALQETDRPLFATQNISFLQSSNQSFSQHTTQSSSAATTYRGALRGGILILAGNPHPGKNRFDEEIGRIQRVTTGYIATYPALDVTLDDIPIEIERHKPEVLHICAHVNDLGLCLRSSGGHAHVDIDTVVDAIADTDHSPQTVVLNFCGSYQAASRISEGCKAIGWPTELDEHTAGEWSASFYLHLRHARPIERCLSAANRAVADLHHGETASISQVSSTPQAGEAARLKVRKNYIARHTGIG
ncbi:hypothetical protein ACLMAJ_29385 [Nocardia sp. KC 131]|uniref:hypothetical protein n=1 Tax=Nocardia arseniciresistens TaxID=3392119 RepID=UPI00398EB0F1